MCLLVYVMVRALPATAGAVESNMLVSVAYVTVILAENSSLDLLTEPRVLEGIYVSGMSAMPWNEGVEPVSSVRPRTK